ncbi:DUF3105 domain-containing protein [Streptomyces minutiscleroticus]|uniref:Membrane protein n=1 Tax=Streptomyces minutiscleroticus TaxID=68238 RepID=A0A918K8X3_9ACTN|nr:DUF3105 domain-containing protein [Streptomyces minutiscleroticus]GGX52901.1 membrane protein [Streptomyces minutiscleroticus]
MGTAPDSGTPSHPSRAEGTRRGRVRAVAGSVLVVAALVAGGTYVVSERSAADERTPAGGDARNGADAAGGASGTDAPGRFVTGEDGVRTWRGTLSRHHVSGDVDYPMTPPVGGDHAPVWMNCDGDVYAGAVRDENAVHALEHGAVWVTYNGRAPEAEVKALAEKVRRTPYTLMSPVAEQKDPVVLSAWGRQRAVKGADDPALDAFFSEFVQGEQTPEPGASCTGGLSE